MQLDDQSVLELARRNPDRAFHYLVENYSGMIYNVCLNLVLHREDAEDLTQEVFTAAYTSLENFEGKSKVSTWLYSIALNKSKEFLRAKTRQKRSGIQMSLDRDDSLWTPTQIINFDHPGVILENKERAAYFFAALQQLPPAQREAWTLHKLEGLSYMEVSEILETTVPSVESLMFRAKKRLQEILGDYFEKKRQ
ncbi:MAG: hypothetical protein A3D92_04480 [Bacteroidetes bacterium RIFCSPHIGHO2_02_FULL_44_7]|nr:MAG: hypothetical protein A3D92_04480 [Bacteroidetes bacterium RIFCSPHIGHO2_02_FULL_44_7]